MQPLSFYNDIDPFCCNWLRNLVDACELPPGHVEQRSIMDVQAKDVEGFIQCHWFCGIGGWPLALQLAGWPPDAPVWTASLPCQPLSCAGAQRGHADERHLWPAFYRLVRECSPAIIFGEQVASKDGLEWLDGVFADLEDSHYTCGAADLCSPGVTAPHIRQRLYWVAVANGSRRKGTDRTGQPGASTERRSREIAAGERGSVDRLEITNGRGLQERRTQSIGEIRGCTGERCGLANIGTEVAKSSDCVDGMAHRRSDRPQGTEPTGGTTSDLRQRPPECGSADGVGDPERDGRRFNESLGGQEGRAIDRGLGPWDYYTIVHCRDGKSRRISAKPGDEPLVARIPVKLGPEFSGLRGVAKDARRNRIGRLRGYGNAIVPQVAAEFVRAFMEIIQCAP